MTARIIHGDALAELRRLPDESVDAVVTDPPYGLAHLRPDEVQAVVAAWASGDLGAMPAKGGGGFQRASWDSFVPPPELWAECLRVLRPGGHLAAFAGARTQDIMGMSLRFAGFEIRDGLAWIIPSGMPHGQDVSKLVDAEVLFGSSGSRAIRMVNEQRPGEGALGRAKPINGKMQAAKAPPRISRDEPATPEGAAWRGWSTHLRPANEPILLARKPMSEDSTARNVLRHRNGALNVAAASGGKSAPNAVVDEALAEFAPGLAIACPRAGKAERPVGPDGTKHPTVKPVAVMSWVVRLLAPAGGVVLDPFAGSGTTLEAAEELGVDSIGIEREAAFLPLIEQRLARAGGAR